MTATHLVFHSHEYAYSWYDPPTNKVATPTNLARNTPGKIWLSLEGEKTSLRLSGTTNSSSSLSCLM
jgi:hypothetical protein